MNRNIQRNKYDKKDSKEMGDQSSSLFEKTAKENGWTIKKSTGYQDINEHWDYLIEKTKGDKIYRLKVEVKSKKRINRHDEEIQDEWAWIELHSVRAHDKGWLINSKADFICFERKDSFEFYDRLKLLERVMQLIDIREWVDNPSNAKYKLYDRRKNKTDILTLIEFHKIKDLVEGTWTKGNKNGKNNKSTSNGVF